MLFYLYHFFEDLLITVINDLRRLDYRNLNATKCLLLVSSLCIAFCWIIYSLRSFSAHCVSWIENIFNWKNLGFLGWSRFIIKSFNEIKFSLAILIAVLVGFGLVYNQYINRHNARIGDILLLPVELYDHEVNVNADLNRNDRQNVHNGTISKHVMESINRLVDKEKQNKVIPQMTSDIYHEIRDYLIQSTHPSTTVALDVLDQMHNFNASHVSTNMKEMDILRLIWQRIKHPVNNQVCSDLKEALLLQLADCKPNGVIMCLTGRITRVLQSLECIDAENIVDLKPLWAIKDQIADYFGRYSDKLLGKVPEKYQSAYESIKRTPDQQKLVDEYNKCLKLNLNNKFKSMYIETKILTQKQLDELSKTYFDNIENL